MTKKINYLMFLLAILFSGCGDKIVKMNEYKDIKYSYHPHSSYELESKTYKELRNDSQIEKKIDRYALRLDKKIDENLNDILNNHDNSNIMNGNNMTGNRNSNRNNLFNDRFDNLKINR